MAKIAPQKNYYEFFFISYTKCGIFMPNHVCKKMMDIMEGNDAAFAVSSFSHFFSNSVAKLQPENWPKIKQLAEIENFRIFSIVIAKLPYKTKQLLSNLFSA